MKLAMVNLQQLINIKILLGLFYHLLMFRSLHS